MIKKYLLDLTKAEMPDWWPATSPLQIQVQDGCHHKELDVSHEEMAKPWAGKHFKYLNRRRLKYGFPVADPTIPIGFNRFEMPKGAKLINIKDES